MREEIEEYFFSHSDLEFRNHFNLSHANVRELKKLYNLYYSKEQIVQKQKELNAVINSIISVIGANFSDYRKKKYIYDSVFCYMTSIS